jgi:aryl-alcohol dehydrogenase-like predicted oxidoreductase
MSNLLQQRRQLGSTDVWVTPLGLGGAGVGRVTGSYSDERGIETILRALELGIRLIDTSNAYAQSQRRIGLALEQWYARGGRREDLVLSTKAGRDTEANADYSPAGLRASLERSCELLKTDYLDVALIHDPPNADIVTRPRGALDTFRALKAAGLVRAIGMGVRRHDFHQAAMASGEFDVSLTYFDYNLVSQTAGSGVLEPAARHGVGVFNGSALAWGILGGGDPREIVKTAVHAAPPEMVERAHELWLWSEQRNVNLLALNLQFCLRDPRITSTLLGCASPEEIEADLRAAYEPLPVGVWDELHRDFGI